MKKRRRHGSVTQTYIDLTDRLAAMRSVKELIFTAIIIALAVSCAMYVLFDIVPVKGSFSKSTEEVSVLIHVRWYQLEEDDVIVLKKGRLCATVLSEKEKRTIPGISSSEDDSLVPVRINKSDGGSNIRLVEPSEIEGKISFVVFPLNRFGEDIRKLF